MSRSQGGRTLVTTHTMQVNCNADLAEFHCFKPYGCQPQYCLVLVVLKQMLCVCEYAFKACAFPSLRVHQHFEDECDLHRTGREKECPVSHSLAWLALWQSDVGSHALMTTSNKQCTLQLHCSYSPRVGEGVHIYSGHLLGASTSVYLRNAEANAMKVQC